MKIAVICDTHFGARNDSGIFAEYFKKFYRDVFFPKIDELGIDTIFHLGDLVDRRKYINYVTSKIVEDEFIGPIRDRNITCHLILGNHDTYYKNTNDVNGPKQLYGNDKSDTIHIYGEEPVELEFGNTTVMLSPWICDSNSEKTFQCFENTKAQILMGHFEISGFEMMKGRTCERGLDVKLFDKFDSVYSGHFHHPSTSRNVTYLGAPYEMTWTDYGGKRGFHVFDTESLEMTFVENPFSIFHKLIYDDTDMTVEDIEGLDMSVLKNTYVKVIVNSKENPYVFDLFVDKIHQSGAADIKIVEDHTSLEEIKDIDLANESTDTLTMMIQYVNNMEIKKNKKHVENVLREIHQEALSI